MSQPVPLVLGTIRKKYEGQDSIRVGKEVYKVVFILTNFVGGRKLLRRGDITGDLAVLRGQSN